MSEECCKNCKFCKLLYVPPCKCFEEVPKDRYVCVVWTLTENGRPHYLGTESLIKHGACEMYTKLSQEEGS